jgi:hypothetical protein
MRTFFTNRRRRTRESAAMAFLYRIHCGGVGIVTIFEEGMYGCPMVEGVDL